MARQSVPFDQDMKNVVKVWISVAICASYCYFISRKIQTTILRFISLLPIIFLFCILPPQIYSFHLGGPWTFFLVWLGNFKLLLFTFNQGPLSETSNLFHFLAVTSLPIKIKQNPIQKPPTSQHPSHKITKKTHASSQKPNFSQKDQNFSLKSSLLLATKVALVALVINTYKYRPYIHPRFLVVLLSIHLYIGLEIILAISALPVKMIFGFELEPQFKEPYLTTSLQDFWGRRWNLMVTNILRPTVYNPIIRICEPVLGYNWAQAIGTMGSFTVSGLMHEVLYYYGTRVKPTWEVTWFFVLHGICVTIEVAVKRAVSGKWRLNGVVSGILTWLFLWVTAYWWFYPQVLRNGLDKKAIGEYFMVADFIKSKISRLF